MGWALINRWKESVDHAEETPRAASEHGYPEDRMREIQTVPEEAVKKVRCD